MALIPQFALLRRTTTRQQLRFVSSLRTMSSTTVTAAAEISTAPVANSPLVQQTADFVRDQLKSNDASHDWRHIERVWTLARTLAQEEVRSYCRLLYMLA